MRGRTCCLTVLLTLAAALPVAAQDVRMLNGFNTAEELERFQWGRPAKELSREHVTEGTHAIKMTFPGNVPYGGFGIRDPKLMADWHRWDLLTFDVFNPSKEIRGIVIRIDDDRTTGGDDWATWYTGTFKVFPGENHIEIEIAKLKKPHAGKLNTDKLRQLMLWTATTKEDKVLYFDNFALRKFRKMELPAGLRAFDFGGEKSAVQPGFTLVTEASRYTDASGSGFVGGGGLRGYEDAPRAVEALGKDAVGGSPLKFAVKLPDGRYRLWAATGWVDDYNWPRKPYTVKANDTVVFEHRPESLDEMQAADVLGGDYSRSADLWKTLVAGHLFDEWEAEVRVTTGRLELSVESEGGGGRLRGLAIWPVADAAAVQAVKDVHAARREVFHKQWREIRPTGPEGPVRTGPEELARGFALVRRNLLEKITPDWRPDMADRFETLPAAGTPGERAVAVFIVYPVRDVATCTVTVPPMKGPEGSVIGPERVEVNTVQYRYCRSGEDAYTVELAHLVPRSAFAAERHVPRVIWMNVNVPADAKPGKYAAPVAVSADGRTAPFVLELEVYPFTLDRPEAHGVVYAHASRIKGTPGKIEADLRCLQKYGCNSITPSGTIGGKLQGTDGKSEFTFDRLDVVMAAMKKIGMTGPVPLFDQSIQGYAGGASKWHVGWQVLDEKSDWAVNMTRLTRQIIQRAKEKDYLPVLMYPSTEISNDPNVGPRFNSLIIRAIRAGGECKCISSVNRPEDIDTAKELDHIMLNFGAGIKQETLDRVHASGAKLWFQNVGMTRYVDGLFMLRAGAVGHRQWVANWPVGDPYSDWDGMDSNAMLFPSPTGVLPSIRLAWMGEGVKDMRYFLTLRRHIAEARRAGLAGPADAAQKEMDAMIASCPVQLPDGTRVFEDGLSVIEGFRDLDTFDRYRRRAAELIINLRKAMGTP